MNVLVDTSAWSLLLRRTNSGTDSVATELTRLIRQNRAVIIGAVRQEVLSGIRGPRQFDDLKLQLRAFPDLAMEPEDYETGAEYFNRCRAKGVQGSPTDFLICATAARRRLAVLSADTDFGHYARFLPIKLHRYS